MRTSLLIGVTAVLALLSCNGVAVEASLRSLRAAATVASPAVAAPSFDCTWTDAKGQFFNFNQLIESSERFGNSGETYYINPCRGDTYIPLCADAPLCVEFADRIGHPLAHSKSGASPVFSQGSLGVKLTYHNAQLNGKSVQTVFEFYCDLGTNPIAPSVVVNRAGNTVYNVQYGSTLACPVKRLSNEKIELAEQ